MPDRRDDPLRALREQVYRRDPDPAAVARYAAALEAAERERPGADAERDAPAPPRPRRPPLLAVAGAGAVVAAAAVAASIAPHGPVRTTAPTPVDTKVLVAPIPSGDGRAVLRTQVLGDPEHLAAQDYYAFFPADLPEPFGVAGTTPLGYEALHGTATLPFPVAPGTTQALVSVTCADEGVAYAWTVIGRAAKNAGQEVVAHGGGGDCHALAPAPLAVPRGLRDARIVVTVPDDVLYAVSVFEH
ncbi:hypothetical protein QDR37_08465 [Amnibacterium sp. CER49]|uniref:hypothetical protein n=1 Tax=Amnibacterium sp. CER49 TaxID=3039161 RepID=UPI00244A85A3|nr:hypothetical protein [Amnibacterium sp. CER49]MDH2443974.1 hypothetical protein [Amnibacterium sp. CER49]